MITFNTGQNNYQTVEYEPITRKLTTTFTEQPIVKCESLRESLQNDVRQFSSKKLAVMFSGGMDSEVVLEVCRDIDADFYAVFCLYTYKSMPVNTHELYHVEKYCRENDTKLKIVELDLEWFFEEGEYIVYARKYLCDIAQITPYLWIIDQIDDCLLLGGDAPHITESNPIRFFEPIIGQTSVERMFAVQNRTGIPNFLTHSLSTMIKCLALWSNRRKQLGASGWKRVLKVSDRRLLVPDSLGPIKQVFPRWAYATIKHGMYIDGGFDFQVKPKYSSPFGTLADLEMKQFDPELTNIAPCARSLIVPCQSMINLAAVSPG